MTISAKILLDSISPAGARLTTFELKYPRFIHNEFLTHRCVSRNAASSRAIPVEKMIQAVLDDPAVPVFWGKNQKGMQASEELDDISRNYEQHSFVNAGETQRGAAKRIWLEARDKAVEFVRQFQSPEIDLHKQIANRILEPWMHITVIASATNWANFFHLRTHKMAQPEFQALAKEMKRAYDESQPTRLFSWDWHMPLVFEEDWSAATQLAESMSESVRREEKTIEYPLTVSDWTKHILRKVSVGRCARVSYLSHQGKRDLVEDIKLHDKLIAGLTTDEPLHMSPFEHVARAQADMVGGTGNFRGFSQYRSFFAGEAGPKEQAYV